MTTFGQLTDDTLLYLYGFTTLQEQETYLSTDISASETLLPLADTTAVSRGTIEIGEELIRVDEVNPVELVVSVPPYGRGYRGTIAATHASGSRVVVAPMFPRKLVKDALNQAVQAVFPMVTAVGDTTFAYSPAVSTYALPAGANSVIAVTWQTVGPSKEWIPVRRWRVDSAAAVSAFSTGSSISLYDPIIPGRSVKVLYQKAPSPMTTDADVFTTVTGLPASMEDVVRLGAAIRLVPFLDSPHLSGMSAEADFSANMRPVGGSAQLGRFLMQQYQIRLQEEAAKQDAYYPHRSHYTR